SEFSVTLGTSFHRYTRHCEVLLLSRFAPSQGLVALCQTFVRRCHGGNCQHCFCTGGGSWPHRRCWIARPPLGWRWPARLVATGRGVFQGPRQARVLLHPPRLWSRNKIAAVGSPAQFPGRGCVPAV